MERDDIISRYYIPAMNAMVYAGASTIVLMMIIAGLVLALISKQYTNVRSQHKIKLPPHIPSTIPFLGNAIIFGKTPIEFLLSAYHKYGPVFSFTMLGQTFTYLIGSEASSLFFNSKNDDLNAEEVYGRITTPMTGKGVAFGVANHVFLQQKKIIQTGLNIGELRRFVPIIEAETLEYFERWGSSGEKDLFAALSELVILSTSRCLHGKEIRQIIMDENVFQLYMDLHGGFTHMAWLLPSWLPFPSFRTRDRAHKKLKEIFHRAINERLASGVRDGDILQALIDSTYKDGRHLTNDEISGMLLALLLSSQVTSSTAGSWLGFFLARDKKSQLACYHEQVKMFGPDLHHIGYDGLKDCQLLECCLKETLRLRSSTSTMMRMCRTPQTVLGYTIPAGHQVCVSLTVNQRLPDTWQEPDSFKPNRFQDAHGVCGEDRYNYVPFGAGRHRCIGETFANVLLKTIWSTLIRRFEFDLVDGYFPDVNVKTLIHTPINPIIRYRLRTRGQSSASEE